MDSRDPERDEDVPACWRSLGLPGLVDVHVHFMPPSVQEKVWAYFDQAERHYGTAWPIRYRVGEADRVARLHALGVRAYPALAYAHKPGMAEWLSRWTLDFSDRTPGCVPSATFYPEPGVVRYVGEALARGARMFKVHLRVGGFDPREPVLDPVWGMLAEAGAPVVVHCGSGPVAGRHTGPGPIGEVLRRHQDLTLVIAHLGMPEYAGHLALARRYPRVYLDTTMAGTDFIERTTPLPRGLLPDLAALRDRVLLGSDFPSIPYDYAHQITALHRLGLGDDWLRAVLWHNGAALLDVAP